MKLKIHIVDAFADEIFSGNPAAVVICKKWLTKSLMQSIATENNLSETAFLVPTADDRYSIRWFSPFTEVSFCGHATLASASVIFHDHPGLDKIIFSTNSVGKLTVTRANDGFIQMDFPNLQPLPVGDIPEYLLQGLSITPSHVLRNDQAYFAVYDNEEDILNVQQQKEYLEKLAPYDVVVTAQSNEYDFISRYFWPANGGNEDPVTGSIHAGLAPYWAERLDKKQLIAYQASRRGGIILCRIADKRVLISGKAIHYLEGYISV